MGQHVRSLTAAVMVIVIAFSFIAPLIVVDSPHLRTPLSELIDAKAKAITFPTPLNTSVNVTEYPLVSRALMLPGGSTDAVLADLNADNLTDLVVAVSGSKSIAIFFRLPDGNLLSNPSLTIPLSREPVSVSVANVLSLDRPQIVVLEKKNTSFDSDHVEFYELTSETTFQLLMDRQPTGDAVQLLVGNLSGDSHLDLALALPGSSPMTIDGVIQILLGPFFNTSVLLQGGLGCNSISILDANDDGLSDLALANSYEESVMVYYQPFKNFMSANETLGIWGKPISVNSGRFDGDLLDDIVVCTHSQSSTQGSLRFFYQALEQLPPTESLNVSVDLYPSRVVAADTDADGKDDILLALSQSENAAAGFVKKATSPIWRAPADIRFPTGEGPRSALFGSFDSSGSFGVAISSARTDWSGSSITILPDILDRFSNSNGTLWADRNARADSVSSGDVNGDGLSDLLLRYSASNAFGYMQSGLGPVSMIFLGYAPSHLIVCDFNSDGYDDILTTPLSGNESRLYFGSASGPSSPVWLTTTGNVTDVSVGDLSDDSLPDIAMSSDAHGLEVFVNTGSVATPFGAPTLIPLGTDALAIAVADFDSDGKDDVAYSHATRALSILLQKDSKPYLAAPADLNLSTSGDLEFAEIWGGDITGDGKADIVGMMPGDSTLHLFDQDDFIATPHSFGTLSLPDVPVFVSVMDVTDDGGADVVASFDSADMLFLYKQEAGGLPPLPSMVFATGAGPNWVAMGDGTGDGRIDLLVNNAESHSVSVWEMINTPPLAVAGGPFYGAEGDPVTLWGSAITQVSELPLTDFHWDFGDGQNSSWTHSPVATHVYTTIQTYNATLIVRDPFNFAFVNSSSAMVVVSDGIPHVSFTWSPEDPVEGQLVVFTNTSTSFDEVVLMNWTIDGSLVSTGMVASISERLDNGTHNVTLQLRDADGSVNSTSRVVVVNRSAPTLSISSPASASEGTPVTFYAVVDAWHTTVDVIKSYEWNFEYVSGPFESQKNTTTNYTSNVFESSAAHANYTVALRVTDEDGDFAIAFTNITVYDIAMVSVSCSTEEPLFEFEQVNFTVTVNSAYSVNSFDWDFDSNPVGFNVDMTTQIGQATHTFADARPYMVKVRASMSNGSYAYGFMWIYPLDLGLSGSAEDMLVTRNPGQTNNITFDARILAARYPDVNRTVWDFGDGTTKESFFGPSAVVYHSYVPDRNYQMSLTLTDDDNNTLVLQKTLRLNAPVIELRSPDYDSVVRSGTVLSYRISDDSSPMVSVMYYVDGGSPQSFSTQWDIATAFWSYGAHAVMVRAEDPDGNIALSQVSIFIDDVPPVLELKTNETVVYGGSKMTISVSVDEPNVAAGGVLLFVKFPGDDNYSWFPMMPSQEGTYYRTIEIPSRSGHMEYYVEAIDRASNTVNSSIMTVTIKLHLVDVILPYLLVATLMAVLGTAGYFMREARIAVDETFVIYNDGRLISHSTRRLKPGMDDQVLSGMLVAIQDFVRDSFKDVTQFDIRRLEFGEKSVLIEKGDNLFLAVILHGKASKKVASRMQRVVAEIEETFEEHLTDWDGDLDKVRGVTDIVKKLYSKAPLLAASFMRRDT